MAAGGSVLHQPPFVCSGCPYGAMLHKMCWSKITQSECSFQAGRARPGDKSARQTRSIASSWFFSIIFFPLIK